MKRRKSTKQSKTTTETQKDYKVKQNNLKETQGSCSKYVPRDPLFYNPSMLIRKHEMHHCTL